MATAAPRSWNRPGIVPESTAACTFRGARAGPGGSVVVMIINCIPPRIEVTANEVDSDTGESSASLEITLADGSEVSVHVSPVACRELADALVQIADDLEDASA